MKKLVAIDSRIPLLIRGRRPSGRESFGAVDDIHGSLKSETRTLGRNLDQSPLVQTLYWTMPVGITTWVCQ